MSAAAASGDAAPSINPPSATEAARLAQNLARNCGWPVFPCSWETKRPTRPKAEGGAGYKDATTDPDQIAELWRRWPGALIGVPTGLVSGISVLDLDAKHDEARAWWTQNRHRIPPTRRFRTRSGGMHVFFEHRSGIGNTQAKIAQGVDTRGDGGYAIFWYAAGLPCLDHMPPAPWPDWLHDLLHRPVNLAAPRGSKPPHDTPLIRTVREAREGERNGKLFWAACRMRAEDGADLGHALSALVPAAVDAGLADAEARRTITSAWR